MINIHKEGIESDFEGTIIDVESIGYFERNKYPDFDTRQYRHTPIILGFITRDGLEIHYVEKKPEIKSFIGIIQEI